MNGFRAQPHEAFPSPGISRRVIRSERDLIKAARAGSKEALESLTLRHWNTTHRIAFTILGDRHVAEDVTQEAMLAAITNIGRFDIRRPFAPWLHRIATNRALDAARVRGKHREVALEVLPAQLQPAVSEPFNEIQSESSDHGLEASLSRLSPEHRAVVSLRYIAGYETNEIAKLLGIPRGTVGSRLRRALDQLRSEMEANRE